MNSPIDNTYSFGPAFERQRVRILAVPADSVRPINLDVPTVGAAVLGVVPKVASFRPRLLTLPEYDLPAVDALEETTMAMLHAHAAWNGATLASGPLMALSETAVTLREQLTADGRSMVLRKLIDGSALDDVKALKGYRNVAVDLLTLASVFRGAWASIQGRTAVTEADLAQAESVGAQILRAVGERENADADTAEVALTRARAFTLVVNGYDELRRGLGYLRHAQGDVDTIAPSLYSGKKSRSREDATPAVAPHAGTVEAHAPAAAPSPATPEEDGPFR